MSAVIEAETTSTPRAAKLRRFEWLHVLRSAAHTRRGVFGLSVTGVVVAIAVFGPLLAPHNPNAVGVVAPFAKPSASSLLGGDVLGRDVLSRVLVGGWRILLLAAIATAIGSVCGALIGMVAAYFPGWRDTVIMRGVDVFLAFPQLVFALLLVSILGNHLWLVVIAVGLSHTPQVARVMRATSLDVAERDYVKAVAVTGVKPWRVMTREILPNLITPLMVETGLRMTWSIIIMAGLAFLGFGFQPPDATWGYMVRENQIGLTSNPWGVVAPAILLAFLAIGVNTFTDAVARVALGVDRAEHFEITET